MISYSFLFLILVYEGNAVPFISTSLGDIVGHYKKSYDGRLFSAFEGIPYAKPPVGELRFKDAEPYGSWMGTWNANFLVECPQVKFIQKNYNMSGQEDCLYLNIYVPRKQPIPGENLDVLVHIHGGGFLFESGHSYPHPEFWMDREIIYVTFNYRLGIFGFLSTEDDVLPGNNGMKDQVLLLKWVQKHISNFGGNPDSVTIFGMSAGGISVHLHYFSPLSKGLFARGFSNSGVALYHSTLQQDAKVKAKRIAKSLGCPDNSSEAIVKCLRQKNYKAIWEQIKMFFLYESFPLAPFTLTIEKGSNGFLTEHPYKLLSEGKVQDLPWLVGVVSDEGMILPLSMKPLNTGNLKFSRHPVLAFSKEETSEIDKLWPEVAPYILDYNYIVNKSLWEITAHKIRDHYLAKDKSFLENMEDFGKLFGDRTFLLNTDFSARLQARHTKSPIYFFSMGYPGEGKKYVGHAMDNLFYFYKVFNSELQPREVEMKDLLINMVVSFAKTGKPEVPSIIWDSTGYEELIYLNISSPYEQKVQKIRKFLASKDFWLSLGFAENEHLFE